VKVTDNGSPALSDQEEITVIVNAANQAPVLAGIGNQSVIAGQELSFTATAADEAGQALTFFLTDGPSGAVIDAQSGVFSWTPSAAGTFTFVVKVTDNGNPALSDQEEITVIVSAAVANNIRINSGGPAFTASGNRLFIADAYFGGTNRTTSIASGEVLNTTDDVLYRTERSAPSFNYNIPVQNGTMNVVLHFAEIWWGVPGRGAAGAGRRRFHVDIEGSRKLDNYDISAKAGGAMRATQETILVTVTDGVLNINFSSGSADMPKISAIEVLSQTPVIMNARAAATDNNDLAGRINQEVSETVSGVDFVKSKIYPNPVQQRFTIEISERHDQKVSMELINGSGRAYDITQREQTGSKIEIDLSSRALKGGVYLLKVQSSSLSEVIKVLIVE
jgi:hypothetical protein